MDEQTKKQTIEQMIEQIIDGLKMIAGGKRKIEEAIKKA